LLAGLLGAGAAQYAVGASGLLNTFRPDGGTMTGRASVIDGDTIEIQGQRVRFNGIDAPESDQQCDDAKGFRYPCGEKAAAALDDFLEQSRPIRCDFISWDRYGRFVGDCFRADGVSVAAWLVEQGQAMDWPRYSDGRYAGQQSKAKGARRGIWQGEFQEPWDWRHEHAASEPIPSTSTSSSGLLGFLGVGCNIKGNISVNTGERIYHVPGQEYYEQTVISSWKGERWFCSEEEARAAGWRRAGR
jgi:endonuclease YncB( thermonuclease family)